MRLVGIDSKAKKRVLEAIIQRPNGVTPQSSGNKSVASFSTASSSGSVATSNRLDTEVVDKLRQLLAGGNKISAEHVDERRFRMGSWTSCGQIQASSIGDAIAGLEGYLSEYQGEYVRLVGVDPKAKRRVLEAIIQRPNGAAPQSNGNKSVTHQPAVSNTGRSSVATSTRLNTEVVDKLRQLLAGGNKISAEHVDERRFRMGSWASCGQIEATSIGDAIAGLEGYLSEYQGEYVRLIGIDPKAKRRVLETIIQRP